ncbi:MAG: TetR family transcriptional regulator [Solirubrobacteraceae bacterium]
MALEPPTSATDGRRVRHEHRRRQILEAVADHLSERGLEDLRSLGAGAGVSHRTLLYHFGSRDRLLRESLTVVRDREQARVARIADAIDSSEGELDAAQVLRAAWAGLSAPERIALTRLHFQVQGAALSSDEPAFDRFLDDLVHSWIELLRRLVVRSGVPERDGHAVATYVYAGIRGLMLDLISTGDRERIGAGFEQLVIATLSLLPPAARGRA